MNDLIHNGFVIGLPQDWCDKTEVLLQGPRRNGVTLTLNVVCRQLEGRQSSEQFARTQKDGLSKSLRTDQIEFHEEGPKRIDASEAYQRIYSFSYSGKWLTQIQMYVVKDATAYIVTATTSRDDFAFSRGLLQEAIDRFRFQ